MPPGDGSALTYVDVSYVSGEELTTIINDSFMVYDKAGQESLALKYPEAALRLRWHRLKLSLICEAKARMAKDPATAIRQSSWNSALKMMDTETALTASGEDAGVSPTSVGGDSQTRVQAVPRMAVPVPAVRNGQDALLVAIGQRCTHLESTMMAMSAKLDALLEGSHSGSRLGTRHAPQPSSSTFAGRGSADVVPPTVVVPAGAPNVPADARSVSAGAPSGSSSRPSGSAPDPHLASFLGRRRRRTKSTAGASPAAGGALEDWARGEEVVDQDVAIDLRVTT